VNMKFATSLISAFLLSFACCMACSIRHWDIRATACVVIIVVAKAIGAVEVIK
jgi:hypothetical protein